MLDRYAVIGNPIGHSKSLVIHREFARQTGQGMKYDRILGSTDEFARDAGHFFDQGGLGLNVTVPFKEQAWQYANELSPRAWHARAVNTLIGLQDGRIRGDNTDGVGLIRDLGNNHGLNLHGMRILLLGAGGASRGVLKALLETNPASLVIANRTASKARELANHAAGLGPVSGCGLDALPGNRFDLIINATSAGLVGRIPEIPADCLVPGGCTYDMLYGSDPTPFCRWGEAHGAGTILDGLGMLVEQAAESFFLWRGVRPHTGPVIDSLRNTAHGQL